MSDIMDFRLIIPRSISIGRCPNCDKLGTLDRVKSDSMYDRILLIVFKVRSYHCRECKWIGKFFLYKIRNKPVKVLINYAVLILFFLIFVLIINYFIK